MPLEVKPKVKPEGGETTRTTSDPFAALGIAALEDLTEHINVLIGGPTGSGKTRMAASAAVVEEMCPVLFVNCDAGTMSIPVRKNISVFPELGETLTWPKFEKLLGALRATRDNPRFKTIIVDDGVELSRVAMQNVILEQRKDDSNHDPDIPNRADYLRQQERVRKVIRFLRDYPAHFVMTAKTRDREEDGLVSIVPGLAGVLAMEIPGYFDVVGILQVMREKDDQEPTRRFVVIPTRKVQWVKDRTDLSGKRQFVENPTMGQLLQNFKDRGNS